MRLLFLHRFSHVNKQEREDVLVVFLAAQEIDPVVLDHEIIAHGEQNLWPDQIILVVRDTSFPAIIKSFKEEKLQNLLGRFSSQMPLTVVGFDHLGNETKREQIHGANTPMPVKFDDFRNKAMTAIFRDRIGFVDATETYHYENPSGRHTVRFMKLANALVSYPEISFWAFCALPFIPDDVKIAYIDTPALFSLVSAINDHYAGLGRPLRLVADNFGSYGGIQNKQYRLDRFDDSLVLISASSSGSLAKQIAKDEPYLRHRPTHVVFLGEENPAFHNICTLNRHDIKNPEGFESSRDDFVAGRCPMCDAGSRAIPLEGDQFNIMAPRPMSYQIKKTDAPDSFAEVIERLSRSKVLKLGLAESLETEFRQFYIDGDALFTCANFQNRLDYILARSIPAQTSTIISLDAPAQNIINKITEGWPGPTKPTVVNSADLRKHATTDSINPVIVVASVIESGRGLLEVSREMRSVFPKAPLIYIVGMAKSSSGKTLPELKKNLVQNAYAQQHEFVCVEEFLLPKSNPQNPWRKEREFLKKYVNTPIGDSSHKEGVRILKARLGELNELTKPLTDTLFVPTNEHEPLKLQHGFVFWPEDLPKKEQHSQADVFYTIASVLQNLRTRESKKGQDNGLNNSRFEHTVLSPSNFGRFNDGVIQASLLRAAYPHELNYTAKPEESREMAKLMRIIIEDAEFERGAAAAEFLIALAIGQIKLTKEDCLKVLASLTSTTPLIYTLMKICHLELNIPEIYENAGDVEKRA